MKLFELHSKYENQEIDAYDILVGTREEEKELILFCERDISDEVLIQLSRVEGYDNQVELLEAILNSDRATIDIKNEMQWDIITDSLYRLLDRQENLADIDDSLFQDLMVEAEQNHEIIYCFIGLHKAINNLKLTVDN